MAKKKFERAHYEVMAALREQGKTDKQIAMHIERVFKVPCSTGLVSWTCLRLGADKPNAKKLPQTARGPAVLKRGDHLVRRFSPDEDAVLKRMEAEGLGHTAIGCAINRKPNSVKGRLMTLARHDARREGGQV